MKNVLIMNLGAQDLQIKKDKLEKMVDLFSDDDEMKKTLESGSIIKNNFRVHPNNFRKLTNKLLENYPKGIECIDFPIIKSIIKKVEKVLENEKLQKIILIVTNQNDMQNNGKDTIYLGGIIEKLSIDKKLGIELDKSIENVEIVTCCTKLNPSDYDEMTRFYDEELRKEYDSDAIFLNITGGTPAMSFGLLYNTSINSSCRVIPFYTKQNTNTSVKFNICETFRKDDDKSRICEFINKNDYMATKILLEKYNKKYEVSKNKYQTVLNMLKAAHSRIQFDFENASKYIESAEDYDSESRNVCDEFINFLKQLVNKKNEYLLNEVKNNAIYEYQNGAYTDFLGRIFRMQEDIYRSILIYKNVLKKGEESGKVQFTREELEYINSKIKSKCMKHKPKIDIIYMNNKLKEILEEKSKEYDLYSYCTKMNKLKQIRNNSVLAHGYEGVSKNKIDDEIGDAIKFLDNLILKYKKVFDIEINDDKFYEKDGDFNKQLIKLVEEI
ncbi:CRISPR-associated protein (Cas_Cas02710) [Clostridium acidisoli DSM 12555]|uniref:CRISPR-associated protein (Cas_Cas02710) n=1 Tax=Clostridium acidisoli DSM 12555 TaxID=1121291 RepID=A0A1W1XZU5_9CLOT|nr:hypothetical protein [Clostridium acidisoli]SMC29404.1 CRISPR-associated protein (Cas_Cas02710) [Clostridium acidisoli DSM 12555]